MLRKTAFVLVILAGAVGMTAMAQQGPAGMGGPPAGGGPDFTEAAETLGVSIEDLNAAMQAAIEASGGPPPDLSVAAEKLGVEVSELEEALPPPPGG